MEDISGPDESRLQSILDDIDWNDFEGNCKPTRSIFDDVSDDENNDDQSSESLTRTEKENIEIMDMEEGDIDNNDFSVEKIADRIIIKTKNAELNFSKDLLARWNQEIEEKMKKEENDQDEKKEDEV
jgi:hypothetical protein